MSLRFSRSFPATLSCWLPGFWLIGAVCFGQPGAPEAVMHSTPTGTQERCLFKLRMPNAEYSALDEQIERRYCAIDFHSSSVALCPKTWSTSPATVVYDIAGGRFPNNPAAFESQSCPKGGPARRDASGELAMFKMSMNERDTSGTFAPASLLYYHLSRYFLTRVNVPVAVLRTIDKQVHDRRVIEPGLRYTAAKPALRQIHAGWKHYADAVNQAATVASSSEFLTKDGRQLFGVLLLETGVRYGVEVNGTRAGGWGAGQNRWFQRTPPFLALRQDRPLSEAIRAGIEQARKDPAVSKSIGAGVSSAQMVFWMRELTEIVLLDFILGQQDRVGNVDYEERWYWVKDGKVESRPAAGRAVPGDLAALQPQRIRRTWLNDNDAGVRSSYSGFARETHMLDGIAHFSAATYQRLMQLDRDLQARGELYRHISANYRLEGRELELIVRRTHEAAGLLQAACRAKRLRFDLEPEQFLALGRVAEAEAGCSVQ